MNIGVTFTRKYAALTIQHVTFTRKYATFTIKHVAFTRKYATFKPLSHYRVSTHVSTAYQDTKGTSRVRRTYVSTRSSYSSIRSSYSYIVFYVCT